MIEDQFKWNKLMNYVEENFHKKPDLEAILFLIGVDELGKGPRKFSKEEKQDLMHIGTCKVLSYSGYYSLQVRDTEGWPHYKTEKKMVTYGLNEQETIIKAHVIHYFEELGVI